MYLWAHDSEEVIEIRGSLAAASFKVEIVTGKAVVSASPQVGRHKIQAPTLVWRFEQVVVHLFASVNAESCQ